MQTLAFVLSSFDISVFISSFRQPKQRTKTKQGGKMEKREEKEN